MNIYIIMTRVNRCFLLSCAVLLAFILNVGAASVYGAAAMKFMSPPAGWSQPWWSARDVKVNDRVSGDKLQLNYVGSGSGGMLVWQANSVEGAFRLRGDLAAEAVIKVRSTSRLDLRLHLYHGESDRGYIDPVIVDHGGDGYSYAFKLGDDSAEEITGVALQFVRKPEKQEIVILDYGLYLTGGTKIEMSGTPPAVNRWMEDLQMPEVYDLDNRARPEIKDGTFFYKNNYEFFVGANTAGTPSEWSVKNMMTGRSPAYTYAPTESLFEQYGFNSVELIGLEQFARKKSGYGTSFDFIKSTELIPDYVQGYGEFPIAMDFSRVYPDVVRSANREGYKLLKQQNESWCHFVPFCPENPEGGKIYKDLVEQWSRVVLKNGGNPYLYEVLNETKYNCQCVYNLGAFSKLMQGKYGTIARANTQWHTNFGDWAELIKIKNISENSRMVPDWQKFISKRYAHLLVELFDHIKTFDKRDRVYFTEQLAQGVLLRSSDALGMDYREIAKVVDVLGSEGGWRAYGVGDIKYGGIMEDAATSGNSYSFLADVFQALGAGKKPIVNLEHYNGRFEYGERVPSHRSDVATSMWLEIMHGASGSYWFAWGNWFGEMQDWDSAVKQAKKPSWKSYPLLNPYSWSLDALQGFNDFRKELDLVKDKVLPFPRTGKPSVAVFFSYPTLLMSRYSKEDFRVKMLAWYNQVLFNQYPLRIVFEEDLPTLDTQALLMPSATYATPETLRDVERYVDRGGLVVADRSAMSLDEYGSPQSRPIADGYVTRLDAARDINLPRLLSLLEKHDVYRYGTVVPLEGEAMEQTELHLVDRGDFKLCFVVNMEYLLSREVRIYLNLPEADTRSYYLVDLVNKRMITPDEGGTWNAKKLRNGIRYILPAQERVLLSLQTEKPSGVTEMGAEKLDELIKKIHHDEKPAVDAYLRGKKEKEAANRNQFGSYSVNEKDCLFLDLASNANMGFADAKAGDGRGGWMDEGPGNDLSAIKPGKLYGAGVPFTVINPANNGGKGALVFNSKNATYGIFKTSDIAVGARVTRIFMLHAAGWSLAEGETVLNYVVNYDDGTVEKVPAKYGVGITNWWDTPAISDAKFGWLGSTKSGQRINLQVMCWDNPYPERKIRSIEMVSPVTACIPAVVSITAEIIKE